MAPELSWAPKKQIFVRRSLMTGAGTFALLVILGGIVSTVVGWSLFWTLPVAAMLTLGFFIDDSLRWRAYKYDSWQISDGHLLHEDQNGTVSISLHEVDKVVVHMGHRVVLHLKSGQRIPLRYLPFADETASQIRALLPKDG